MAKERYSWSCRLWWSRGGYERSRISSREGTSEGSSRATFVPRRWSLLLEAARDPRTIRAETCSLTDRSNRKVTVVFTLTVAPIRTPSLRLLYFWSTPRNRESVGRRHFDPFLENSSLKNDGEEIFTYHSLHSNNKILKINILFLFIVSSLLLL